MSSNKMVMVLPGGIWQIKLIESVKNQGYKVLNTAPYKDSPGFAYADYYELADALDKEKNLEIAEKYGVQAVLSDQSDIAVPTVAYLNEKLGFPGIGCEAAKLFTNKAYMRRFLVENSFPCPDFKECKNIQEASEFLKQHDRIIIKPIDSQSSRGVFVIDSSEELREKFEIAKSYSNSEKIVLAEEFIEGEEFTIDGIKFYDRHWCTAISLKEEFYGSNRNISKIQYFSHYHPQFDYDKLRELHNKLVEKMGLRFGLTHAEYRYCNEEFYLIEVGARGGGSNLSGTIVPYMSEVNHYEMLLRMSLGEKICVGEKNVVDYKNGHHAILEFLDFGTGTVQNIAGEKELERIPNVKEWRLDIKVGQHLENPEYGRLRPGYFIATGADREELENIRKKVKRTLKVTLSI